MRLSVSEQLFSILLVGVFAIGCGSASEIGEDCHTEASQEECVEGAICTNDVSDTFVCRLSCVEQEDCPSDQNCNGISGTNTKSCQPDK